MKCCLLDMTWPLYLQTHCSDQYKVKSTSSSNRTINRLLTMRERIWRGRWEEEIEGSYMEQEDGLRHYGNLYENDIHGLIYTLEILGTLVHETAQEGLGGVALWEKLCHWE